VTFARRLIACSGIGSAPGKPARLHGDRRPGPGGDFLPPPPNALVTFNPGETTKTVTIPIVNDTASEAAETVLLSLAAVTGGNTTLGANSGATLVIVSNE